MNFLSPINFALKIDNVPDIEYLVQDISIPGIGTPDVSIPTPFTRIRTVPNTFEYGNLDVTFKVGENLEGWIDIYEWLAKNTRPETYDSYSKQLSDGTVLIMNSKRRPNVKFTIKDMFPITLSKIDLSSTMTDLPYVTASASFAFTNYRVEII